MAGTATSPAAPLVTVQLLPGHAPSSTVQVGPDQAPAKAEEVDAGDFSHGYTGVHDHGALPAPAVNAYTAVLRAMEVGAGRLGCTRGQGDRTACFTPSRLQVAKDQTDAALKALDAQEKAQDATQPPAGKVRVQNPLPATNGGPHTAPPHARKPPENQSELTYVYYHLHTAPNAPRLCPEGPQEGGRWRAPFGAAAARRLQRRGAWPRGHACVWSWGRVLGDHLLI